MRASEPTTCPLALYQERHRWRLNASGRERVIDLLFDQHGERVAHKTVHDAASFLSRNEIHIDLARVIERVIDGRLRDLVEDHALDRNLRLELLDQVPRDGLSFAILVCCEDEFVSFFERLFQFGYLFLSLGFLDHIDRLEVLVDVHTEACPRLTLVLRRHLSGAVRKVTDMAHRSHDLIAFRQVFLDGCCFCGGLDDYEF